jgi:chromosome segregation ATPase
LRVFEGLPMSASAAAMADQKPPAIDINAWLLGLSALVGAAAAAAVKVAPWLRRRALDVDRRRKDGQRAFEAHFALLMERLEAENARLNSRFAALEERFSEAETDRQRLMAINATQGTEITALQVQVSNQRGQINYLTEENGRLCAKVDHLEGENQQLRDKVRGLETREKLH